MKKFVFKKWWIWVYAVTIIISLFIYSTLERNNSAVSKLATSTNKEEGNNVEAKEYKIGDIIELKNFEFKVNKLYKVQSDEYNKPKEGNEYLAVECTFHNVSKTEQAISSVLLFKIINENKEEFQESLVGGTAAKEKQLDGIIGPDKILTGVYIVEIPKGEKGLSLQVNKTFVKENDVFVNLN